MAEISVIVPVYKVEPYLRRCVDSILAQTFTDFELILVDDGSPDNCGVICDEYAAKDSRVHVIHQENGGLSAARNTGIDWVFANSDSQWLTFVDSDDWIHPRMLEELLCATMKHHVEISICGYEETSKVNPWGDIQKGLSELQPVEQFYVEHCVNATAACMKLFRRECYEGIRFPVDKIFEDEYTIYKILFRYPQVAVINAPMYAYFMNPQGITKSEWSPARLDKFGACEEQISYFKKNKFHAAFVFRINTYIRIAAWQYKLIAEQQSCPERQMYLTYVKKTLQGLFFKYIRYVKFKKELTWIYEVAFPRIMNLYWLIGVVGNKLRAQIKSLFLD